MITLATLPQATAQEVFDQVKAHLLTQGEKSSRMRGKNSSAERCLYRGPNGRKCAAGCLIADSEYTPEFDNESAEFGTDWNDMINRGLAPSNHAELISELQRVHDGSYPGSWPDALTDVASEFGLKP